MPSLGYEFIHSFLVLLQMLNEALRACLAALQKPHNVISFCFRSLSLNLIHVIVIFQKLSYILQHHLLAYLNYTFESTSIYTLC
jgi:hypothetical protein